MSSTMFFSRGLRVATVLIVAFTLAACAQNKTPPTAGGVGAAAPGSAQDFVVNVGDRVFFATNTTTLSAQARNTLSKQVMWLRQYPQYTVTIEGNADERGTRDYNLALGARRAQNTRDYIVSQGINASRLRTISYGKERPVAVCDNESCWSQNRRAVTVLNNAPGS